MKFLPLIILLSMPVSARIGETKAQCIARYGAEDALSTSDASVFKKSGFLVVVQFHEGKADFLDIRKIAKDVLGNSEPMSDVEIDTLLQANGLGKTWVKNESFSAKQWTTEDGSATAYYYRTKNNLIIATKDFLARMRAETEQKEKGALKDF